MVFKRFAWFIFSALCIWACAHRGEEGDETSTEATFVGAEACKSCHAEAYADWRSSDHFKAMLPAHDSTVLGDFSGVKLLADGVETTFHRNDTAFLITIRELDGTTQTHAVAFTFGHFPLQQYLVKFPNGRMQATRASWDSRNNRWFHQYAGTQLAQDDWLHWTNGGQNWNTMCASCHSTNLHKNYSEASDAFHTTWSEVNVACESCHGPGSGHVAFYAQPYEGRNPTSKLAYGKTTSNVAEVAMCAPCHARKADLGPSTGTPFMDHHIAQAPTDDFYHPDGQVREEDYVYGSFVQSKMYHQGISCTSCHNPHTGARHLEGNALCLNCHEPSYSTPSHHFHPENTPSSQCINCHMTATTYMGNDHRRDHSFRIPRPDQSAVYGTPNACNGCHQERSATWAAEAVQNWYGSTRAYHLSDDLLPGSARTADGVAPLTRLLADTAQPALARAAAAVYLADGAHPAALQPLLMALKDEAPEVRYQALRALARFTPDGWQATAAPLLKDPIRAVRVAAANLFHLARFIPVGYEAAYRAADEENRAYLNYQTDFAVGNLLVADYHAQAGESAKAAAYYNRGLEKDNRLDYARQNLATVLNAMGQNREALEVLQEGVRINPRQAQLWYSMALILAEEGRMDEAEAAFSQSVSLPNAPLGAYSNGAILQLQKGLFTKAAGLLQQGLKVYPADPQLHYLMALVFLQQEQAAQARPWVEKLHELDPGNPTYAPLFKQFSL